MKHLFFLFFLYPLFIKAQINAGDTASAGVIYTNIKDTLLIPKSINSYEGVINADFDIDGDNIKDVRFNVKYNSGVSHTVYWHCLFSLNNFEFVALSSKPLYLDSIARDSLIGPNLNWVNPVDSLNLLHYYYVTGNTVITGVYKRYNNYIGFRKVLSNDTIYGWILVDVDKISKTIVRSWAYTARGVGIKKLGNNKITIHIYPNPSSTLISFSEQNIEFKDSQVEITNYLTQTVLKAEFKNQIDISKLASGIYTLKIVTKDNQSYYSKFVKE